MRLSSLSLSIYLPPSFPFQPPPLPGGEAAAAVLRFSTFSRFIPAASSLNRFPGEIYGRAIIHWREEEGREERRANGKGTHHSRHVRSLLPPLLYLTACLLLRFLYDHPLVSCTGPRLGPNSFQFVRIRCCHFFYGTLERVDRYKEMKRLTFDELVRIVRWKERKV